MHREADPCTAMVQNLLDVVKDGRMYLFPAPYLREMLATADRCPGRSVSLSRVEYAEQLGNEVLDRVRRFEETREDIARVTQAVLRNRRRDRDNLYESV